ncbi:MAG: FAD-binding domain-containing protein [Flavobacteriales bacterium]
MNRGDSRLHVVWYKRDLRIRDHAPLAQALREGRHVLLLHVFEPEDLKHPTTSNRHLLFRWQAWGELCEEIRSLNWSVETMALQASALEVLQRLHESVGIEALCSYEETGLAHTFKRDQAIAHWTQSNGIQWNEFPQQAVQRGLKNRKRWATDWHKSMRTPMEIPVPGPQLTGCQPVNWPKQWLVEAPPTVQHQWDPGVAGPFQQGGERSGHRYLESFFDGRVKGYRRQIGRPLESRKSCSRLSPYLAWGCLSMRQVYQAYAQAEVSGAKMDMKAFGSRLRWQGHFIQKFESESRMEFESVNRGYLEMEYAGTEAHLQAWKEGKTGVPLVDACMRCVIATGYLNFRMRAMLVSFLTHHLDLPWQAGVEHLARCFLDFEPGIHYAQFQMQAGVTGINTIRIYNPVKQGEERDDEGAFVREWLPELAHLPNEFIHAPWKMPPMERAWSGLDWDYPEPIVDVALAGSAARERLWRFKKSASVRTESKRILDRHVVPDSK